MPTTTFSEHTQVSPATPPPPNYGTATLHEYPNLTANAYSPQVNNFGHQHVGVDTTNVEGSNVPPPPTYNEAVHMPKYAPTAGQPPIGPPNYPQPGFVPISGQGYILQAPGQSACEFVSCVWCCLVLMLLLFYCLWLVAALLMCITQTCSILASSTAIGAPQPRVIHTATIIPPGRACVHCYVRCLWAVAVILQLSIADWNSNLRDRSVLSAMSNSICYPHIPHRLGASMLRSLCGTQKMSTLSKIELTITSHSIAKLNIDIYSLLIFIYNFY